MNVEEVLVILDAITKSASLNDTEEIVFRESWQGRSYQEIAAASGYSADYIKDVGAKLWRRLSQALGTQVTKSNLHFAIERYARQEIDKVDRSNNCQTKTERNTGNWPKKAIATPDIIDCQLSAPKQDWQEAIDVSIFYGRTPELATLNQWILRDNCRLIAILGMEGIGKTALAVKLAKEIQLQFDYVLWQSLRNPLPLTTKLAKISQFIENRKESEISPTETAEISNLLAYLKQYRCLLILDNFESIFQPGSYAGSYRQEYTNYGELIQQIAEIDHQSCLLLTSREKPREVALLEGESLPVRVLEIKGLGSEAAQQILKSKGISGTETQNQQLNNCYQGNPLALKFAASSIKDLFSGSIAEFLAQKTLVLPGIRHLLDEQFSRLTPLEKKIMYWLAIEQQPLLTKKLLESIIPPVSARELLEALESLHRRYLIEKNSAGLGEQHLIMEYITEKFMEQAYLEISQRKAQQITLKLGEIFPFPSIAPRFSSEPWRKMNFQI